MLNELSSETLKELLAGCCRADRRMQRRLYETYYSYALGVCLRYTHQRAIAVEVVGNGFLNVFGSINRFRPGRAEITISFRDWLRKSMIQSAIDYFRAHEQRGRRPNDFPSRFGSVPEIAPPLGQSTYDELLALVQQLPPAQRMVFSLFVIDGYSHDDIARHLGIGLSTSLAYLDQAREYLRGVAAGNSSTPQQAAKSPAPALPEPASTSRHRAQLSDDTTVNAQLSRFAYFSSSKPTP